MSENKQSQYRRPWWTSSIQCCKGCVPPKRYPGCGANCEEYKKEKAEYEVRKEKERESRAHVMGRNDFNMLNFSSLNKRPRGKYKDTTDKYNK